MKTTPEKIAEILDAYNRALGSDLRMTMTFERWIWDALQMGLTAEDVQLCLQHRMAYNRARTSFKKSLSLHNLIRSDEDVSVTMSEAAAERSISRVRVMPAARAEVMRATGRPDEVEPPRTRHISEVIEAMRAASA